MSLTPKQEKFCQVRVETGNATEAYRQAYNCSRMKPETINRKAKFLMDMDKIGARIDELQAEHRKRHDITIDTLTSDFVQDRDGAREKGDFGTAVKATQEIGKLHGLYAKDNGQKGATGKTEVNIKIELPAEIKEMMEFKHDAQTAEK
jgi:phage terminase small subunit